MKKILLNVVHKNSPNYKKYFALVDNEDFGRVSKYNWNIVKQSHTIYAQSYINRKNIYLHNFIMGFVGVDHKDMDGLNCQRSNLRKASQQQNQMNRKSHVNSSSRFKGVHWYKQTGKWQSKIRYNSKLVHLGYFTSELEAARTYNEYANKYFKEFARLNIVET